MIQRVLMYSFLAMFCMSCASLSSPFRSLSSKDGSEGASGVGGQNGRDGKIIFAKGCEEFVFQSLTTMNGTFAADGWNETVSFMCGSKPKINQEKINRLSFIIGDKIERLRASGYFLKHQARTNITKTWPGLKRGVKLLGRLYRKLETKSDKDYGCYIGRVTSALQDPRKFNICFRSKIRSINSDGTVETHITMIATAFANDGSLERFRTFEEKSIIFQLPERCENGVPAFETSVEGTSRGVKFINYVVSGCEVFDSSYSAIYPSTTIDYD